MGFVEDIDRNQSKLDVAEGASESHPSRGATESNEVEQFPVSTTLSPASDDEAPLNPASILDRALLFKQHEAAYSSSHQDRLNVSRSIQSRNEARLLRHFIDNQAPEVSFSL